MYVLSGGSHKFRLGDHGIRSAGPGTYLYVRVFLGDHGISPVGPGDIVFYVFWKQLWDLYRRQGLGISKFKVFAPQG